MFQQIRKDNFAQRVIGNAWSQFSFIFYNQYFHSTKIGIEIRRNSELSVDMGILISHYLLIIIFCTQFFL